MPNPFPGVNPYIEMGDDLWVGFHNCLITEICARLNPILNPRGYGAYIQKRIELAHDGAPRTEVGNGRRLSLSNLTLDVAPAELALPVVERIPVAYLEVRRRGRRKPVTSIEVLSLHNKRSRGRRIYHKRREKMLTTNVNLIEIDLLLRGRHPDVVGEFPPGDFYAFVSRGNRRPRCEVYGWSVRRSIPRLPVPLRPGDDDAILDLAQAYAMTFDGGPYTFDLTYDRPAAGLADADREWAADRVRAGAA